MSRDPDAPMAWIRDRHHPLTRAALTQRCPICKAKPGDDCTRAPISAQPLEGRIVHYARSEVTT